jgi:hypothetical protein
VPTGVDDILKPFWHRIADVGEVLPAEVPGPQVLDGLSQPRDRGDVLVLEGILLVIPDIFNGI